MGEMHNACCGGGHRAARPFLTLGSVAVVAGGLIAAAAAHDPSRDVVWMVAYLVLVVGAAQVAFGVGQAALADRPPSVVLITAQFLLYNAGNVAVIGGTLADVVAAVVVGTVLIWAALLLFLHGSRGDSGRRLRRGYQGLLAIIAVGALIGLGLSAMTHLG